MSNIHTKKGFKFSTTWGDFEIGQKVELSKEAKENDNYSNYFNELLTIAEVDLDDMGCGVREPIMSFELENGEEFPFSLYGYEYGYEIS